jgi:hypothetical protein
MRQNSSKPILHYLRVWLLIGIFVGVSGLAACGQTDGTGQGQAPQAEDGVIFTLPYQEDAFPRDINIAGRQAVAPFLGDALTGNGDITKADMGTLQLRMVLPPIPPDTEQLDADQIEQMSLMLVGPADTGVIEIDALFTNLYRDELNGETVIHGVVFGNLIYPDGSEAEMTLSGAAIVEQQQGRFNMIIVEHDDIPGLALQFGDLTWTEELNELVNP